MGSQEREKYRFEGSQSQERMISAMPIRIDYQALCLLHLMRPEGQDWLIYPSRQATQKERIRRNRTGEPELSMQLIQLDPYAIRTAFDSVDTPDIAVRFLSESGRFWGWESVLWSQFQEWQRFFQWLRIEPDLAQRDTMGKKAWDTAAGLPNSFFAMSDHEFTLARFPRFAIEEMGPENVRVNEANDRIELLRLRTFATALQWFTAVSPLTLHWYDSTDPDPPEAKSRHPKSAKRQEHLEPYLRIGAVYVLEAIAATIYADRAHGLRYGKCKHCGKLFKIESGHKQQFCPAPQHLSSSPCKNAYLQKARRERLKDEAK